MIESVFRAISLAALVISTLVVAPPTSEAQPIAAARIRPRRPQMVEVLLENRRRQSLDIGRPVTEVRPSPSGAYVAVLALARPMGRRSLPSLVLEVYDPNGRRVAVIPRAQHFAFSPDDRRLAVIIGTPYEGGVGFRPERVSLFELPSDREIPTVGLENATKLAWLRREDTGLSLFVEVNREDSAIIRYDPDERSIYPTELLGLECSPDGKYYWLTPRESDRAGLCDPGRSGDACIRVFSWKNRPVRLPNDDRLQRGHIWASNTGHEMIFMTRAGQAREAAILDLATGTTRAVEGRVDPSWTPRPGWLVLWSRDGLGRLRAVR